MSGGADNLNGDLWFYITGADTWVWIHTLIFMSVLLSARQVNCLVLTLFKPIKLVIWS